MTADPRFASASSVSPPATAFGVSRAALIKAVLLVTAIAGTLDIIAAHLHIWAIRGQFPAALFKSIAGGALGRERAMQGGAEMMALGAFFHFFISFVFALLFFLLYPRVGVLRKNVFAVGTGYALFVWAVMNCLVLPLSALSSRMPNFANKHTYIGVLVLITVFGLPIALGAARLYRQPQHRA
jgi:hypothetical protein